MERLECALIDAMPGIEGYHESHRAIMRPYVRAILTELIDMQDLNGPGDFYRCFADLEQLAAFNLAIKAILEGKA